MRASFRERYGPWAIIAGASAGLGEAFAEELAARGLHLVLVARRAPLLEELAARLRARHRVEARVVAADLASADLASATEGLEVGAAIYNAAFSPLGAFVEQPVDDLLRVVDVNVRAPLLFARAFTPPMVARGRGALVLMSSLAGSFGAPRLAAYGASKAFTTLLGESLWAELGPHGVDVIASAAGAIRTPGYTRASKRDAPGTLDAAEVARGTLDALGHGPVVVPGAVNKLATLVLGRLLPRKSAIAIMGASTRELA
jgi:uncharacterized protein